MSGQNEPAGNAGPGRPCRREARGLWLAGEVSGEGTREPRRQSPRLGGLGVGGAEWRGERAQRAGGGLWRRRRRTVRLQVAGLRRPGRTPEGVGSGALPVGPGRREQRPAARRAARCWRSVRETVRPLSSLYLTKHVQPQLGHPLWGHVPRAHIGPGVRGVPCAPLPPELGVPRSTSPRPHVRRNAHSKPALGRPTQSTTC